MTFVSPFETLGEKSKIDSVEWELYTGSFSCQEPGCWTVAREAKYSPSEKILTWKCPEGHISTIEDYNG